MAIKTWGNMKGAALRVLVSIASSSAFLLFGYDQGVFAGLIGGNGFKGEFFQYSGEIWGNSTRYLHDFLHIPTKIPQPGEE